MLNPQSGPMSRSSPNCLGLSVPARQGRIRRLPSSGRRCAAVNQRPVHWHEERASCSMVVGGVHASPAPRRLCTPPRGRLVSPDAYAQARARGEFSVDWNLRLPHCDRWPRERSSPRVCTAEGGPSDARGVRTASTRAMVWSTLHD